MRHHTVQAEFRTSPDWKKLFADSYIGLKQLDSNSLPLSAQQLTQVNDLFPIQLSKSLIANHSINSAVLKQYLPNSAELINSSTCTENPVGDIEASQIPGVIKKYQHRALLITSNTCPVHCRYCFRKDFPYADNKAQKNKFKAALEFLNNDTSISEVILSGGDPLSLDDEQLRELFNCLENIPHIETVRIHTKFPSIFPQRVTHEFLTILNNTKLNKVCVFHINHPDEISNEFCDVAQKIKNTGTTLLNQAVLLNQINNNPQVLIKLSKNLFATGVLPYYLHMLDPAKGTNHFQVSTDDAEKIMQRLKSELPGYLVPKLAREVAGAASKIY